VTRLVPDCWMAIGYPGGFGLAVAALRSARAGAHAYTDGTNAYGEGRVSNSALGLKAPV
jgi:hypothetical protein